MVLDFLGNWQHFVSQKKIMLATELRIKSFEKDRFPTSNPRFLRVKLLRSCSNLMGICTV